MFRKTTQALRAQINNLKNCSSSLKQSYVPPHQRKEFESEIRSSDGDGDDEQSTQRRGQALTSANIHKIYQDFLSCRPEANLAGI